MTRTMLRAGALFYLATLVSACGSGDGDGGGGGGESDMAAGSPPAGGSQVDAGMSRNPDTGDTPAPDAGGPASDARVLPSDAVVAPTPDGLGPSPDPDAAVAPPPDPDAAVAPPPDPDAAVAPPPVPDAAVVPPPVPDAAVVPPPAPDAAVVPPPVPDAAGPLPDAAPPADPFAGLSDEFDDPATLQTRWLGRQAVEGGPPQTAVFDVNASHAGMLSIQPLTSGWFGVYSGPFLYQHVRGDIVLEVEVFAGRVGLLDAAPTRPYNSAGIVVRDPVHGRNADNWLMVNIGHQAEFVGTETKTTVNSQSVLLLDEAPHRGRLRLCRVGTTYVMARFLTNDEAWTEIRRYERPDLPDEVQLGLVTNGWNSLGPQPDPNVAPDLFARFGYARFRRPANVEDCLTGP
ncbi:hypothetical protein L6V77_11355 [Myxococcota bacterium]|nr:hypothetical protein [Myxococcota bacterium]